MSEPWPLSISLGVFAMAALMTVLGGGAARPFGRYPGRPYPPGRGAFWRGVLWRYDFSLRHRHDGHGGV